MFWINLKNKVNHAAPEPSLMLCDELEGWDGGRGWEGNSRGRGYIYIYMYIPYIYICIYVYIVMTDSFCFMVESNTTL